VIDTLHNHPLTVGSVPASWPAIRVALVGCGKSKLPHPAPARDLYTGSLFRAARAHVEAVGYDAWFVLSARYGIVPPYAIVGPYEATMAAKSVDETTAWVTKVEAGFRASALGGANYGHWTAHGGRLVVDIFAGRDYADPLTARWSELSWEINLPHHGLQIGERLAAFKAARPLEVLGGLGEALDGVA
jgi:hypothetical protein